MERDKGYLTWVSFLVLCRVLLEEEASHECEF